MSRRHAPAPAPGFTLVEVILASTVVTLVAVSATLVLRGVTEAERRIERRALLAAEARAAADAVADALRNAYRPTGENERMMLEGIDDSTDGLPRDRLRFFTVSHRPVRAGQPESDVREVEFAVLDPGDGEPPTFARRLDPTRNDGDDGGGVLDRIASGVLSFDVTYHDGAQYREEWPEEMGWPTAVKFELLIAPTSAEAVPGDPVVVSRVVALAHGYRGGAEDATATPQAEQERATTGQPQRREGVSP